MSTPTSFLPSLQLRVSFNDHKETVLLEDIVLLTSNGNYTSITLSDGRTVLTCRTLKHYERCFAKGFVRVHRAYMVNRQYVSFVNHSQKICILSNGQRVPITQRRFMSISKCLEAA